jgi:hypothetical protein
MVDDLDRLPSRFAARLITSLTSEAIAECYALGKTTREVDDDSITLFLFYTLCSLCLRYIRQTKLKKTDMEFQKIIHNLAQVSGLFRRDEKPMSYGDTLRILTVDEAIPADIDLDYTETEPLEYVTISRFVDVLLLAIDILQDYESSIPLSTMENLTPEEFQRHFAFKQPGFDNVVESARRTVIKVAQLRMLRKAVSGTRLRGTQLIRKDDNEFPFEL